MTFEFEFQLALKKQVRTYLVEKDRLKRGAEIGGGVAGTRKGGFRAAGEDCRRRSGPQRVDHTGEFRKATAERTSWCRRRCRRRRSRRFRGSQRIHLMAQIRNFALQLQVFRVGDFVRRAGGNHAQSERSGKVGQEFGHGRSIDGCGLISFGVSASAAAREWRDFQSAVSRRAR